MGELIPTAGFYSCLTLDSLWPPANHLPSDTLLSELYSKDGNCDHVNTCSVMRPNCEDGL